MLIFVAWFVMRDCQLHTFIYDKSDDFNFPIANFPFLSSNIPPASSDYGVFISQLIRFAHACSSYECLFLRVTRLSNKLLEQGYVKQHMGSSLRKCYCRYRDLIKQFEVPLSRMLNDILWPDHIQWKPTTDKTLYQAVTLLLYSTFYRNLRGFNRTIATDRHANGEFLLLPGTYSYRIWDSHLFFKPKTH